MPKRNVSVWKVLGVIAAVWVIASVLLPPPSMRHGEKWRQTICLSNQKQLGLALIEYAQDYDNLMPNISDTPGGSHTWRAAIYPYCKTHSIYRCPDDTAPDGPDGFPPSYAANYSGDYNGSHWDKGSGAFAGPGSLPLSLAKFPDPAHLILLCEVQHSRAPEFNIDSAARFSPDTHILAPRHATGSNYLLADGHVKWYRPLATQHWWYRDPQRRLSANGLAVLQSARAGK